MYLTMSYSDGRSMEAIVLALSIDRMRVAVRGEMEPVEFQLVEGQWTDEAGRRIELDSLLMDGYSDLAAFRASLFALIAAVRPNQDVDAIREEPDRTAAACEARACGFGLRQ